MITKANSYVEAINIVNMANLVIPAGSRIDAITLHNPAGSTGTLRIGGYSAGVAGVPEVQTLTVTGEPTADADLTITLDGAAGVVVGILDTDTLAEVAAKVAAGIYPGWTVVVVDGVDVIFTSDDSGARVGAFTFDIGTTGAAGSFAETNPGVDLVLDTTDESVVADVVVDALSFVDLTLLQGSYIDNTTLFISNEGTITGTLFFSIQSLL